MRELFGRIEAVKKGSNSVYSKESANFQVKRHKEIVANHA